MSSPKPLPEMLRVENPTTKLLYTWLEPQGAVSYSVQQIEEALELSHRVVQDGLTRLRALGLLDDIEDSRGRLKGSFRVKASKL